MDGKARLDGVTSFLDSRGITLPVGRPGDRPSLRTASGLGNLKDQRFLEAVRREGVRPYPGSVALVRALRTRAIATVAVSASRNAGAVLAAAGLSEVFDARVDGLDAARLGLPGKPDPALFFEAARRGGVSPGRAAVVEDAQAGVEAARRGGFALVIGVDRAGQAAALYAKGADVVVPDLAEVSLGAPG
ncbi:MAG: HAD family hydrolase [Carbonactinosporaceae bacterium]